MEVGAMPKKQINFPQAMQRITGSKQDDVYTEYVDYHWDPVVTVHWDKAGPDSFGGMVALSIGTVPPVSHADFEASGTPTPVMPGTRGGTSTYDLSRADINRLITALREARDAAYGKDA